MLTVEEPSAEGVLPSSSFLKSCSAAIRAASLVAATEGFMEKVWQQTLSPPPKQRPGTVFPPKCSQTCCSQHTPLSLYIESVGILCMSSLLCKKTSRLPSFSFAAKSSFVFKFALSLPLLCLLPRIFFETTALMLLTPCFIRFFIMHRNPLQPAETESSGFFSFDKSF